jgi:hypothetical protein
MVSLRNTELEDKIFTLNNSSVDFESVAIEVFEFQYKSNPVYHEYCNLLGVRNITNLADIPFLPISFFKSHSHQFWEANEKQLFLSSGTTSQLRSQHFVPYMDVYERSFLSTYNDLIGNPENQLVLALLPNYIEQGNSSLVYMVDYLIQLSKESKSGFFLGQFDELIKVIQEAKKSRKRVVLFGVAYALLDLAELKPDLSDVIVIETGGMKGRRKELTKSELHALLCQGLNLPKVYSEYGMTELLSQGYSLGNEWFHTPNWFQILIREMNDPKSFLLDGQSGGINCIDLANLYSCSFIATDDLGVKSGREFQVLGRIDNSDIRGCNLLVNS